MEVSSITFRAMSNPPSVIDIIGMWQSRAAMARDLCAAGCFVTADRIHKWAQVGSIPAAYHWSLLIAAEARGFQVTAEDVARAHHADSSEGGRSAPRQDGMDAA